MPYGEKLNSIREAKKLTLAKIHEICDVPLSTVTRVFDKKTPSGNFETFVAIAKGLDFSLDELAGLKPPTESPNLELLREKDEKIQQMIGYIKTLRDDNQTLRDENKSLREDNKDLRRGKNKIAIALIALLIALIVWFIVDLTNGHFGNFRY